MEFGGFADQGESEPGAFAAGAGVAQRVETFENLFTGIVGDALAVIADGEFDFSAAGAEMDFDGTFAW